ncbi:MAG: hypothetical protein FRX49_09640 [Trebouxia sp. A1-2]|nr:MAG: hypothetical protein FRX49_09640 [Trebouxia sp. A1-2]
MACTWLAAALRSFCNRYTFNLKKALNTEADQLNRHLWLLSKPFLNQAHCRLDSSQASLAAIFKLSFGFTEFGQLTKGFHSQEGDDWLITKFSWQPPHAVNAIHGKACLVTGLQIATGKDKQVTTHVAKHSAKAQQQPPTHPDLAHHIPHCCSFFNRQVSVMPAC